MTAYFSADFEAWWELV